MVDRLWFKFVSLLLVPALALAQLACVCAGGDRVARVDAEPARHACCDAAPADPAAASRERPGHDPRCPHCAGESRGPVAAARGDVVDAIAFTVAPHAFESSPAVARLAPRDRSLVSDRAFASWITDPSPPPDLLRVKCSLQI